jgi:predicted helicase
MAFIPNGKGDHTNTFGPEDVFNYIYAIFHSPSYRSRYGEFLKGDFPRVPFTSNVNLFNALCQLGEELVSLHLMEKQSSVITQYPVSGSGMIEQVKYTAPKAETDTGLFEEADKEKGEGRIWINRDQYFEGVSPEVWAFHIGGYQVCQKWLKDRKGRKLTYDDLLHYQRIVSVLATTINLMSRIDAVIEDHKGWPIC